MSDNGVNFPGVGLTASGRLEYDTEHWKEELELRMDGDNRIMWAVRSLVHKRLDAVKGPAPIEIPIGFHNVKAACAQIITYEVQTALDKFPGLSRTDRSRWPKGLRAAQNVADHLMDAAELEKQGQAVLDEAGQPAARPDLSIVLGGD